jgi:DNA mismatch repair protein MutS
MSTKQQGLSMTPIRKQYLQIKRRYPHAIVFFRLGDFYETFDEDARVVARELEITLTSREMGKGQRVPLAGIPCHAIDNYLGRLVSRGHKIAICEQVEEAPPSTVRGKGIMAREVVRVITPGTVVETNLLISKENNYLAAAVPDKVAAGLAYVDVSTGEFATTQMPGDNLLAEVERLHPAELLLPRGSPLAIGLDTAITLLDDWVFELEGARQALLDHFEVASLEAYGCAHLPQAIRAAAAVLHYLGETQRAALAQLTRLSTYSTEAFMTLDAQTRRNLEIYSRARAGTSAGSLLSVIDLTKTAMGGRLLRRWLNQPLLDREALVARQEAVEAFHRDPELRLGMASLLGPMPDLERLTSRVSAGLASPREVVALGQGLELVGQVKGLLEAREAMPAGVAPGQLDPNPELVELVRRAIAPDPPATLAEGGVIRDGFSPELDGLKASVKEARRYIAGLERAERERTGIKSLKVGYNKVFGYYIEVSKPNLPQVPPNYIRKQTLVGGERFITPELKDYENLILSAQEKMVEMELSIFKQLCQRIGDRRESILATAGSLAQIDCFCALAEVAARYDYVRPELTEDEDIVITAGRHPVVERHLAPGEVFVPNDTRLSTSEDQIIVLTGPNMAGKSTYLRQVALIVLLAQIGSFVPARSARIGLVDRIFTRVGAQDDLAFGQSTFMVEMVETANILNHATRRSLIILDEIGRGTSTYDGLAIARSVVEYLHHNPRLGAKTLFATHYHELVEMASILPRVKNYNVVVSEEGGQVVFLHRIVPGGADKSYGIHVAQLAGLPRAVIQRAHEVLADLENTGRPGQRAGEPRRPAPVIQLSLFPQNSSLIEELAELDVDSLTPLEAITKLYELKRRAQGE